MILKYIETTSAHVVFEVLLGGDGYQYSPPVVIAGMAMKPAEIQAPRRLPGNTNVDGYLTPAEGLWLHYAEYEPFTMSPDGVKDYYEALSLADVFEALICRHLYAYYLCPGTPEPPQPTYPHTWEDPHGWTHGVPATFGDTAEMEGVWIAANESYEGMAVHMPYAPLLLAAQNTLPPDRVDGRFLCLSGGGVHPLYPKLCLPPQQVGGLTNFCISVSDSWDGLFWHGYGNTTNERTQMMYPDVQNVGGFQLENRRNTVVAFPLYSQVSYADEFIDTMIYVWPSFSPAPPRAYPPPVSNAPAPPPPLLPLFLGLTTMLAGLPGLAWLSASLTPNIIFLTDDTGNPIVDEENNPLEVSL